MGCTAPRAGSQLPLHAVADTAELNALPIGTYRVQIGDRLDIQFFNNPEFNQEVTVRPDGKIALPYVDDVQVAGLTPSEVDAAITEPFRGVLLRPEITVIVREFAGQRVYVGGEVNQPGFIPLTGRTTALQAILSAGGFLDTAQVSQVLLIRRGLGNRHAGHALDLGHVLRTGQTDQDVMLQPSDVVYVHKTRIAKVNQFVDQYIRRLLPLPGSFGIGVP
jgi:protein involved in polysaccharide export with SLBB domain